MELLDDESAATEQRTRTSAIPTMLVYVLFYVACDIFGFSLTFFRVFGVNALAAYMCRM